MHRDGEVRAAPDAEDGPRLVSASGPRNVSTSERLKRKTLNENNARSEKSSDAFLLITQISCAPSLKVWDLSSKAVVCTELFRIQDVFLL